LEYLGVGLVQLRILHTGNSSMSTSSLSANAGNTGSDFYQYTARDASMENQYYGGMPSQPLQYNNTPHQPWTDNTGVTPGDAGPIYPVNSPASPGTKENTHRLIGYSIGIASVCLEHALSHPCIVLRRQCQVHHNSKWFHTTPFSLFPVIINMHYHQSITSLWKGIGSKLMVRGITAATEAAISEFTPLPKEVTRHSSWKRHLQHLLLEGLTIAVTTPFYAASVVESVQSEIASEIPGVLDCLQDGIARLVGSTSPTTRLLPVWRIAWPVVVYGLAHYVISSVAQYTVKLSVQQDLVDNKELRQEIVDETSIYETYYPELIATFTGHLLSDVLLFPLETIMHRLVLQGTRTIIDNTDTGLGVIPIITRYEGFMDCALTIIREEGFSGFYKGMGCLILQYGFHMVILRLTKFTLTTLSSQAKLPQRQIPSEPHYVPTLPSPLQASAASSPAQIPQHSSYNTAGFEPIRASPAHSIQSPAHSIQSPGLGRQSPSHMHANLSNEPANISNIRPAYDYLPHPADFKW